MLRSLGATRNADTATVTINAGVTRVVPFLHLRISTAVTAPSNGSGHKRNRRPPARTAGTGRSRNKPAVSRSQIPGPVVLAGDCQHSTISGSPTRRIVGSDMLTAPITGGCP